MNPSANTIKSLCELLRQGRNEAAGKLIESEYPFSVTSTEKRTYTAKEAMGVFVRDGFIDRYSGAHLVFPGTLRLIHRLIPDQFPFHKNWKMSSTHTAFWELYPTIDHVVPVARGGPDIFGNWVTTSQLRNSAKSNWLLDELGWQLLPSGSISDWDGLTNWFLELTNGHPEHLADPYINKWHKAAFAHALPNNNALQRSPEGGCG